jgi:hypothetical protein
VAIVLDERARAVIGRRRAACKDDRLYVSLERGSMRVYAPWIMRARWMPRRRPDQAVLVYGGGNGEVYADPRIARYAEACDLVISAARFGPWRWPVLADPFAFEHMREWERGQVTVLAPALRGARPPKGQDSRARARDDEDRPMRGQNRAGFTLVEPVSALACVRPTHEEPFRRD